MKNFFLIALLLLSVSCQDAKHSKAVDPQKKVTDPSAEALSPEGYLRKLSFHIRGNTPDSDEYEQLQEAVDTNKTKLFFKKKTLEYLDSPQHADKMAYRLEELFFLNPAPTSWNPGHKYVSKNKSFEPHPYYQKYNSLNQMFREIGHQKWDTLLTGKSYMVYSVKNEFFEGLDDRRFLMALARDQLRGAKEPKRVNFDKADPRIAGALTTSRFFNRYVNTTLNKNRKRSAAIFRIFLCDEMNAVVVDSKGNLDEVFDLIFPEKAPVDPIADEDDHPLIGDKHGTDPACMKCHYKLDPLGKAFQLSGLVLAPFSSKGSLVYERSKDDVVEVEGRGIGDLGQAITEQPEYVSCQVKHFWKWFVGEDIPLVGERLEEVITEFDSRQRMTNSFISYLVEQPEFGGYRLEDPNEDLANRVKGVLRNCNGCHAQEGIPSFSQWPIGGNLSAMHSWVTKIEHELDLGNDGANRTMPTKESAWQPKSNDLQLIKFWISVGAPNEKGVKQFD